MVRNTITEASADPRTLAAFRGTGLADELAAIGYPTAGPFAWMTDDERCQLAAIELAEIELDRCCQTADDYRAAEMRDAVEFGRGILGTTAFRVSRVATVESDGRTDASYVAVASIVRGDPDALASYSHATGHGASPRQAVAEMIRAGGLAGGQSSHAPVPAA